jgi:hypothetical protein
MPLVKPHREPDVVRHAIERMCSILKLCIDEHRPDIIEQVIELGKWALENDDGQ